MPPHDTLLQPQREDPMEMPTIFEPERVATQTFVLPSFVPLPGLGVLPVNAYLIRGAQPVLIDAGLTALSDAFVTQLESLINLDDLRWIWLTHTDPDHIGAIEKVLAKAPKAKVVTTYLGAGKMGLHRPLPADRIYLLNPGQELDLGDRKLAALRPPIYDAPETTAVFDTSTRALFSADCFGALMDEPMKEARDIPPNALSEGMLTWASVDAPWLEHIEERGFTRSIDALERLSPKYILGGHLPPAIDMTHKLAASLRKARGIKPFVGPDQATFEAMMQAPPVSVEVVPEDEQPPRPAP